MKRIWSVFLVAGVLAPAVAGPVATRPELDVLLDDAVFLEDFEFLSLHGGSTYPSPNPLNAATAPALFSGIVEGVTYSSSTGDLELRAIFAGGDDDVVFGSTAELRLDFDQPQLGVGFNLLMSSGITYTVSFYAGSELIGQVVRTAPADGFIAWAYSAGIDWVTITPQSGSTGVTINDLEWGITPEVGEPCSEADVTTQGAGAGDLGYGVADVQVSAADLNYFVNEYIAGTLATADITTQGAGSGDPGFGVPDGLVTAADLNYFVNAWVPGCP